MSWENGEFPANWTVGTIGDVAKVVGGGTPSTSVLENFSETDGHPWITPSDLSGFSAKYISRGRRFLTDLGFSNSSAKYLPAGSVLFSTRAPIGYAAIASVPVTTNQGFRSFVPNGEIDPEFLYYALRFLKPIAEQMASGTTFSELSGSKAARLPLAYPSREVQTQIVQTLDIAFAKSASASARLNQASILIERFRQAVLAAACSGRLTEDWRACHPDAPSVDHALGNLAEFKRRRGSKEQPVKLGLPRLPDNFIVGTIGEVSVLIEYGTSKRADASPETGIPVLRMGNIQDGRLDLHDLKYVHPDYEIDRLRLEQGDLLFNRTNSPELVGKSAVFHEADPMSFASYLIRVRFAPTVAEPDFVNYWINSAWGRTWARLAKTDGVSQSNINGSKLALMPLPLPPIEEQRVIVERASQMLQTADRIAAGIQKVQKRVEQSSNSILSKAFRGELVGIGYADRPSA